MKIIDSLRRRSTPDSAPTRAADPSGPPMRGYDKLDDRQIVPRLHELSQVDLEAVETYERAHANRSVVLAKLRYLRTAEPLPGYDALSPEQIADALEGADAETIKGVRDYERKFAHRPQVMEDAVRMIADAKASPEEARDRAERDQRVRDGIRDRQKTAQGLSDDGRPTA
jgi:hypothetical protein